MLTKMVGAFFELKSEQGWWFGGGGEEVSGGGGFRECKC